MYWDAVFWVHRWHFFTGHTGLFSFTMGIPRESTRMGADVELDKFLSCHQPVEGVE